MKKLISLLLVLVTITVCALSAQAGLTSIPTSNAKITFKLNADLGTFAQRGGTTHGQGLAIAGKYVYTALVKGSTTQIARTNLTGGSKAYLSYNKSKNLSLGHCNDMAGLVYGSYTYLFVAPCDGSMKYIVVLKLSGATIKAIYKYKLSFTPCAIALQSFKSNVAKLFVGNGNNVYTVSLNMKSMPKTGSTVKSPKAFTINIDKAISYFGSAYKNKYNYPSCTTGYFYQGFGYDKKTDRLYVPICAQNANRCIMKSCMLVYEKASTKTGTVKASSASFRFKTGSVQVEVETIDFYGSTMYLSTNVLNPGTFSSGKIKIFKH